MPEKPKRTRKAKGKAVQDPLRTEQQESGPPNGKEGRPRIGTVVGIGASAGGLRPLEGFFRSIPADTGMCFVVAQHHAPGTPHLLAEILAKTTQMRVMNAGEGMGLEPNTVYIQPSDEQIQVVSMTLRLEPVKRGELRLPIDALFRSLAADLGECSMGIILSGTGSDGTLGLKEIKAVGGITIVQDPGDAEYRDMPKSAINHVAPDFILPVSAMGDTLRRITSQPIYRQGQPEPPHEAEEREIQTVLRQVRTVTGHDFSQYKRSTIDRRIGRRMALHQVRSLPEYIHMLRKDPGETQALFSDLIINVTSFFRDPQGFDILERKVILPLMERDEPDEVIRVWVPACASGEEAYSIGMLFLEHMDRIGKRKKLKIFGSDINPENIEVARRGFYPENIAQDLSRDRLARFFSRRNSGYQVDARVRELMVFAVHDITRDPPFSGLDLLSCRNLLIYMNLGLQQRILPMMHYALKPGGFLFLGPSEGVADFSDLFTPVDKRWKLFRSKETNGAPHLNGFAMGQVPAGSTRHGERKASVHPAPDRLPSRAGPQPDFRSIVEHSLMQQYVPPGVLLDEDRRVVYFHGDTEEYLRPPKGDARFDISRMIRSELRHPLERALRRAASERRQQTETDISLLDQGRSRTLDLVVTPMAVRESGELMLVTFQEHPGARTAEKKEQEGGFDFRVEELEGELLSTRQDLQATIEELETSNEELKSANEELQANNEELQSTNEELDTSREELQSTNEELQTVNAELQRKNEELSQVNDDIKNLFAHAGTGTVILDTQLRVKRFTPAATRIFNLIDKDVDRPLSDIASQLEYLTLEEDALRVLDTLQSREMEVRSRQGRWYHLHIFPYKTTKNVIEGVVINLTDVTELKQALQQTEGDRLAGFIVQAVRHPMLVLDGDLRVRTGNKAFYELFQLDPGEVEGLLVYQLGGGRWNIPELKDLLERVIPGNESFEDYLVDREFPGAGRMRLLLNGRRIERKGERPHLILLALERQGEE
jgi:two-component system, chemotaxis family, CheB/CheR fusion protein